MLATLPQALDIAGRNQTDAAPAYACAGAFAALAIALGAISVLGEGRVATELALRLTARLAFVFFWPTYTAGALVTLFGARFEPLKRRARALGLGFSSVIAIHLGFVGWLCVAGSPPGVFTFVTFGIAAAWVSLLTACSFSRVGRFVGRGGWWILRNVGMNYVAFAFALDFLRPQRLSPLSWTLEYLPFAALSVVGPCLRLAAWLSNWMRPRRASADAREIATPTHLPNMP